ncbi:MAG TPA: serine hydrolase domain-containing protein [Terriglobales bacterium]|nr:serine hydrolase domain-containing protein [Terriglobales bacterium]
MGERKLPTIRFTLAILVVCTIATAHAADTNRAPQIGALFSSLKPDAPGAAVLVLEKGNPVFERGYGITDLRTRHKIDARTNFRLASCTKQFTAMAIMLLVHDGKLHYDEPLTGVFPEFPAYGKNITIRNLLNHTSGLLDYEDLMQPQPGVPEDKLRQIHDAEVLKLLEQQTKTKFAPGTHWDYSNSGYVVLAMVVEKASGKSFGDFLHERIFVPLQMNHTIAYEKGKNEVMNRAYGHTAKCGHWTQNDQSDTSATLGDGGVYSSLEDLAKWDRALSQHALLSETEMQPAWTAVKVPDHSVKEPDGKPAAYGFGWFLNPYKTHARMWHYGETVGFRTTIQRFAENNLTVIILANRDDLVPASLAKKIAYLYLAN